ncbi:hypothetical protein CE143_05620 [Photorhabdus luminescens]|uniref:Uncharacterized protein n=1 Tax=Photorhabdus akhurstii TaxID=171438 RepID=A0ABX8LXA2_9GAMM|nr:hypothetical protein [Photorhabdus akhurstii]QXF32709.1 hypothetical protein B0X70_05695 [Photorhabdus akhurstii]UJD74505.1 hypothetical protein CE143_05620 [Photorhabdus luminescens]
MSNDVCGYLEPILDSDTNIALDDFISNSKLGIQAIPRNELYNYPDNFTPNSDCFIFLIGDVPGYPNATYLTDYYQYDPETVDIGFPANPKERLDILITTLLDMIKITKATKMVVSITECEQIETIKKIHVSEMRDVIHADFEIYQAPPDTLYEITCN